jgi:hypothetical protein
MWEAVEWGLHCSALTPDAIAHFAEEVAEKVCTNQAQILQWEDIKDNPPQELKLLPYLINQKPTDPFWTFLLAAPQEWQSSLGSK